MRRFIAFVSFLFPLVALAAYDTSYLPYGDAPSNRRTAVAVSFLTEEGILQGYPDGTFQPEQPVKRAEFLKVAMRASTAEVIPVVDTACFPDIDPAAWYAPFVCAAKRDGLVSGDALDGIDPSRWRFRPARTVNYAEAAKILVRVFAVPTLPAEEREWYEPFLAAAETEGISLPGVRPGTALTRGDVAELVASFLAYSRGELPELRAAQEGRVWTPSSRSSLSSVSSFISSSSFSSSPSFPSSSSSHSSFATDPGPDFSRLPTFLRLGTTSPILGAAKIFNNLEPFTVDEIDVVFTGNITSIDEVRIYATADGRYLGNASRDPDNTYTYILSRSSGILSVPKRQEVSIYARAVLRSYDSGGVSAEHVQIDHFTVKGWGEWSMRSYSQSSTDTFGIFETARSTFTSAANAGASDDALIGGPGRTLGSFSFTGGLGDGRADLRFTDLTFEAGVSGGVTLSNVKLGADGSSDRFDCSVAGSSISCSGIAESVGTVAGGRRTLTLYGDIDVPESSVSAGLQISLTPAGSANVPGAATWTDGTTSFTWLPFDESQLRSTYYRQ